MKVSDEFLPLQRIYHWEKTRAHQVYLSQPMGQGAVRDYTWAQAVGEARRMAAHLRALGQQHGWEAGTRIGILSKNCAWWIMSDFAIWMAGYISVPLYPTLAAETVRQILVHSDCRALFVGKLDEWPQMQPGVPEAVHCISYPLSPQNSFETWDDIIAKTAPIPDSPVRPAGDLATIVYTSGTTGMPKGVMHSFFNFSAAAITMLETFGLGREERILSYLPLAHVAERFGVETNSLQAGFRVYFAESLDTFLQDLQRARPTLFFSVPRLWVKFQQGIFHKIPKRKLERMFRIPLLGRVVKKKILRQLGLDSVRFAATGAAPLPESVLAWYRELGLDLMEVYGMTENFGLSHSCRPGQMRVGYVGSPWPNVECRFSDTGEVLMRAPWQMLGYYREPEKTRETLTDDGFLRTGDVGEVDEMQRLRITGRAKEIFKTSKGKYVSPAPIENKLGAHPGIEAVCVAGANQAQPCALAMPSPDAAHESREALTQSLGAHLESVNATLDPHEQLAFIALVKEPWNVENNFITPTMKIKRNVIEAAY
ncbi:MAG TPA: AMP-binding protein, partial [Stenotrophobium sp.]|nr:AMP-binding protein [Stenotrophobium sp.]